MEPTKEMEVMLFPYLKALSAILATVKLPEGPLTIPGMLMAPVYGCSPEGGAMTSHTLSSAIRYQRLPDFHTSPTAASVVNVITSNASNVMRRKICLILVDVVLQPLSPWAAVSIDVL